MSKQTQWMQVLSALRQLGGIATLTQLNSLLLSPGGAGTNWKTKTPEATIRRIVRQKFDQFHILKRGLYCLKELAPQYENEYNFSQDEEITPHVEERNHSYYQGLLIEIGNRQNYKTYVPAQDGNKMLGNQKLSDVCDLINLPDFGYENFVRRATSVDVIWFNRRDMPTEMFEVEMSTDMRNSLIKFNELRDFYTQFKIVAPAWRKNHFDDRIEMDTFHEIHGRVKFVGIDDVEDKHVRGRW